MTLRMMKTMYLAIDTSAPSGRIVHYPLHPGRCPGLWADWAFSPHSQRPSTFRESPSMGTTKKIETSTRSSSQSIEHPTESPNKSLRAIEKRAEISSQSIENQTENPITHSLAATKGGGVEQLANNRPCRGDLYGTPNR